MKAVLQAKKAILMTAGAAAQKFMMELEKEQEILMNIADMAIEVYTAESTLLRTKKRIELLGEEKNVDQIAMTKCFVSDALERVHLAGKHAICAFTEGDEQRMMLLGVKRFTKLSLLNTIGLKKQVAQTLVEADGYCF
jgi:hypothetical protein